MEVPNEPDQPVSSDVDELRFYGDPEEFAINIPLEAVLTPDKDAVALSDRPAFFRQINDFPLLTAEQEIDLAKNIQNGDEEAYVTFFQANLRLVLSIALKVWLDVRPRHLDLDDLIMEGNFGLMDAIEGFDVARDFKFSTYAYPHIHWKMKRAISAKDRTIHIGINAIEKVASIERKEWELQKKLGRQPTEEEVAKDIGMTAAKLATVQSMARPLISIHAPVNQNGESSVSIGDRIVDDQAVDPEKELFFAHGLEGTGIRWIALDVLDKSEYDDEQRFVMEQYYGLDGGLGKTFKEIAGELGYGRNKVQNIHHAIEQEFIDAVRVQLAEEGLRSDTEAAPDQKTVVLA